MPQGLRDTTRLTDASPDADVVVDTGEIENRDVALRGALEALRSVELNASAIQHMALLAAAIVPVDAIETDDTSDDVLDVERERAATATQLRRAAASYPARQVRDLAIGYSYITDIEKPSLVGRYRRQGDQAQLYHLPGSVLDAAHHMLALHVFEQSPYVLVSLLEAIDRTAFAEHVREQLEPAAGDLHQREAEMCALAVEQFKSNPEAFAALYPEIAEVVYRELHVQCRE